MSTKNHKQNNWRSKFRDRPLSLGLYTLILPRLEVFFLEEWIEHNLMLGVDKIYIYDNGLVPVPQRDAHWRKERESDYQKYWNQLSEEEKIGRWENKPQEDYFEDYSDEQIYEKLQYFCI